MRDKNRIVDQLAAEVQQLTAEVQELRVSLSDFREREGNIHDIISGYEKQLIELKEEVEAKDRQAAQLGRQSIDMASLIEKVNFLQYELANNTHTAALEKKLSLQGHQIKDYKEEIDKLNYQLKMEKTDKHSNVADQYSTISELHRKITELDRQKGQLEMRALTLEKEMRELESHSREQIDGLT